MCIGPHSILQKRHMREHADETPQQVLNLESQSITIYDRTTGAKSFVEIVLRRRLCGLVGEC
jgi:hypothetical protein